MVANVNWKPFNPLLGETYEFQNDSIEAFSEQVSHHPPITANYCRGKKERFLIWNNLLTKSKFRGTCLDFADCYRTYVELLDFNEQYELINPSVSAHNLVFGTLYIDIGGTSSVRPMEDSGLKC